MSNTEKSNSKANAINLLNVIEEDKARLKHHRKFNRESLEILAIRAISLLGLATEEEGHSPELDELKERAYKTLRI